MAIEKPVFLFALPFVCLLFLIVALDIRLMVTLILFSRALLDPVLNMTKGESGGLGFGAVLNLFVLMLTFALGFRHIGELRNNRLFKSWLPFLVVCLVAVFYSPAPFTAIRFFFNLTSYLCMALLPFLIDSHVNDKKRWIKVLAWSSVLPVIFANVDLVRGGRTFEDAGSRILGTFTHPNILAFYLVFAIALFFYILKSAHFRVTGWRKAVILLYMANLFFLLLGTKTRNAWISCWLLFFIYGLIKERKYLVISLLAVVAGMALPQIADRAGDLGGGSSQRMNSLEWRVELWKSAMPWIKERFFFGYGLSTFSQYSRSFFLLERKVGVDAHNTYVQILFETGIAGLLAYVAIYIGIIRAFFSRVRAGLPKLSAEYAVVLSYVITYLLSSVADNMFYYLALNWYFWFLIGVMLKAMRFHAVLNPRSPQPQQASPHAHLRRRPVV